ncbi:MAG: hypothetical protein J7623_18490 [Chitinophaga sp.]|uniref:hypothetical protein n=1 Tax=Chitinophaga sp. TaxID=1869181 RepID=UPI001B293CED|nr:hypothetical protein [Chitinophaga sp.]MBO9730638.1 hypothetical protein [Chitinophaga sp.]
MSRYIRFFRTNALWLLVLLTGVVACKREAVPMPSGEKYGYRLPQGNQPFDADITAFYKKYHCYILYKYSPADFRYAIGTSINDTSWQPDPANVAPALSFLMKECLQQYPDSFLQQVLPYRILLPERIDSFVSRNGDGTSNNYVGSNGFAATDYMMAFGWANKQLLQQTPARLKALRGGLHRCLWKRAFNAQELEMPDSFALYQPDYLNMDEEAYHAAGLVTRIHNAYMFNNPYCLGQDFLDFIGVITSTSAEEMEGTLLSPQVDVSGLIRVKYDVIRRYYQRKYNIDLQAIGNRP